MPVYTPPVFNTQMDRWIAPRSPNSGAPDISGQLFQVYGFSRLGNFVTVSGVTQQLPVIIIREPPGASTHAGVGDVLRSPTPGVPFTPAVAYKILFTQIMHQGFPNVYIALYCVQCTSGGAIPHHPQP